MLVANDQCRGHPFAMLGHCQPFRLAVGRATVGLVGSWLRHCQLVDGWLCQCLLTGSWLCHCLPIGTWLYQVLFAHWQLAAPLFAQWQLAGCITACCPQHAINKQCLQQIKQCSTHRGLLTRPTMQLHLPAAPSVF